jgi:hypothetical protein
MNYTQPLEVWIKKLIYSEFKLKGKEIAKDYLQIEAGSGNGGAKDG